MSNISLESAIRTCKVDTAYSNKVQSDRFLNPDLMVCPIWNGVDTTGREVCPDSYWTKNAGCNSAEDRVMVENSVSRPQYMEYINLSANGIDGAIYGNTMPWNQVGQTREELDAINNVTGNFGLQFGANTYPGCNYYPYEQAVGQEKQAMQSTAAPVEGFHFPKRRATPTTTSRERYHAKPLAPYGSQMDANYQQAFRQQGALNQGFMGNQFRKHGGN